MTYEQFQKKVLRSTWYDKYWYCFVYASATFGGLYLLSMISQKEPHFENQSARIWMYILCGFMISGGIGGLYLIPNRYKVLKIDSQLNLYKKEEVILELIKRLGGKAFVKNDSFYNFTYQRKWWTTDYDVYLSFEVDAFHLSVLAQTRGGIIDFGGTEEIRQKILNYLLTLLKDFENSIK